MYSKLYTELAVFMKISKPRGYRELSGYLLFHIIIIVVFLHANNLYCF